MQYYATEKRKDNNKKILKAYLSCNLCKIAIAIKLMSHYRSDSTKVLSAKKKYICNNVKKVSG